MTTVTVPLKGRAYPIVVGNDMLVGLPAFLKKLGVGSAAAIITNPVIYRLHGRALTAALKRGGIESKVILIEDSERSKSLKVACDVLGQVARYSKGRKLLVIAFGGGVVGDLAGFVASIFKRGVPLVQVPTTLLAQIDSSIGGKVAVDLPEGKNLAGSFYQPAGVFVDTAFLKTLSDRQVRNGLAEAVKYGAIIDKKLFTLMEKNFRQILNRDERVITEIVLRCARIKANIVGLDEKETKGLRTILNFGHTVGHAIETAAGYEKYHHGEAVAIGMRIAGEISRRMKLLKAVELARLNCLLSAFGLPETIGGVSLSRILKSMSFDKKFVGARNRFVLLKGIGAAIVREGIAQKHILAAIKQAQ